MDYTVIFLKNEPEINAQRQVAWKRVRDAGSPEEAQMDAELWVACHVPNMEYNTTEVFETERIEYENEKMGGF